MIDPRRWCAIADLHPRPVQAKYRVSVPLMGVQMDVCGLHLMLAVDGGLDRVNRVADGVVMVERLKKYKISKGGEQHGDVAP